MRLEVDIKKRFDDFELEAKFEVENEVLSFLGASGCGKSIVLRCIAGTTKPDKGRIVLDDVVLFDSEKHINLPPRKRNIGYLFQDYALFPNMSVEKNIMCVYNEECKYTVDELLQKFFITKFKDMYPAGLSAGQQQRVALARMVATNPKVILLDEPFMALESFLRWQLEQEMFDVLEDFSGIVLHATSNPNEAYRLSDRIAALDDGKLVEISYKKKMFNNPQRLTTAYLTGCKNFTNITRVNENTFWAKDWGVNIVMPEAIKGEYKFAGYRSYCFEPVENMEDANCVECDIIRVIEDAAYVIVHFTNGRLKEATDWNFLCAEIPKGIWKKVRNRAEIYFRINPKKLFILEE